MAMAPCVRCMYLKQYLILLRGYALACCGIITGFSCSKQDILISYQGREGGSKLHRSVVSR